MFKHIKIVLIALAVSAGLALGAGCGSDTALTAVPDPISVNTLDGSEGVPVDSTFEYVFSRPVNPLTVTTSTFFIVKNEVSPSLNKAVVDDGICDSTQALDVSVECSSPAECTLTPAELLEYSSVYSICLAGNVRYATGERFDGFMATFTTEATVIEPELPESYYGVGFNIDDGATGIDPSHDIVLTFGEPVLPSSVNDDTFFLVPVPAGYSSSDGFDPALCIAPDTPLVSMQSISDKQFSLTPIDHLDHVKCYAACAIGCDIVPNGITYSDGTCAESKMVIFSTRDWAWIPHNEEVFSSMVGGLAIDFNDPDTVYVLTPSEGVYKSIDGGETWTAKNNGFPENPWVVLPGMGNLLTMDPNNPSVLYTNMYGKVYKTVDGAENWVESNNGIEVCAPNYAILGVAVDPQNSDHLLAGHIVAGCSGGIFESFDGGATWVQIAGTGIGNGFIGNDAWTVAIDPTDNQRMYSASIYQTFHYSTDGGNTWAKEVPPGAHANSWNVVVHPTHTNRIFLSNHNGLYMSDNYGLAGSWTDMTATVGGLDNHIGFAPWDTQTGYITGDTGFYKSTDGGLSWSLIGHADLGLRSMAIHPTDPNIVYAGSASNGVYKFIWE